MISTIAKYAESSGKKVIQIHLVLLEHCIWIYGPHGYRIYTIPMQLKLIESIEKDLFTFEIYELGGEECLKVHKDFITNCGYFGCKWKNIRYQYPIKYFKYLKKAIIKDLASSAKSCTNFYALKIFHNF